MDIQILQPTIAAQIAAGEVVEWPASVVKELVENAIDAGATQITVPIEQGGTRSVGVQDNGSGIPAEQAVTTFARQATSKLRTGDGEAATQYRIRYGEPEYPPRPTGAAIGASITVEDLFGNQPARLKFLCTKPTEATQVQRVVARYAMVYPGVRFQYTNDGNETFRTNGTGRLLETILSIMGHDTASKMLPVLLNTDDANVSGYVGITDLHRSNRNDISVSADGH